MPARYGCALTCSLHCLSQHHADVATAHSHVKRNGASWWNSKPLSCRTGLEAAHASQAPGVPASATALPHLREQVPGTSCSWTCAGAPGLARALILEHSQENPNQEIDVKHLQSNLYGNAVFSKQALLMCYYSGWGRHVQQLTTQNWQVSRRLTANT